MPVDIVTLNREIKALEDQIAEQLSLPYEEQDRQKIARLNLELSDLRNQKALEETKEERPGIFHVFGSGVSQFFSGVFGPFVKAISEWWQWGIGLLGTLFSGKQWERGEDVYRGELEVFVKLGIIDEATRETLMGIIGQFEGGKGVRQMFLSFILLSGYLQMIQDAASGRTRQELYSAMRPYLPDAGSVIRAAFLDPDRTPQVHDVLARSGIQEEDIDLMLLSYYRTYGEDLVRDLALRGELTPEKARERLREMGYTDERIDELQKLWQIIPGPQDILHMVAKEAFEPDAVALLGLDDEFPTEQAQWLAKQGLSDYWQKRYWRAHWMAPGIAELFQMLHRGLIDENELRIGFRTLEIPPYWRDKLEGISYHPYTRVDVRRMHLLGVIDDTQLLKAYMDLGYDSERAKKMVEWTLAYNKQSGRELTRSQIETAYKERILDRQTADNYLQELGYDAGEADFILTLLDYNREKELTDAKIENVRDRYTARMIGTDDAKRELSSLPLPTEQVSYHLDKMIAERREEDKVPSRSDLDKFLKAEIIDEREYREEMARLGFSARYTDWYYRAATQAKK